MQEIGNDYYKIEAGIYMSIQIFGEELRLTYYKILSTINEYK